MNLEVFDDTKQWNAENSRTPRERLSDAFPATFLETTCTHPRRSQTIIALCLKSLQIARTVSIPLRSTQHVVPYPSHAVPGHYIFARDASMLSNHVSTSAPPTITCDWLCHRVPAVKLLQWPRCRCIRLTLLRVSCYALVRRNTTQGTVWKWL